jgi:hypothetical protein
MSVNGIKYTEFVRYVHRHFEDRLTEEQVNKILFLKEGYNKDSPTSLGKSLLLNRLIFSGQKRGGEKFIHDQHLYTGINAWIADNHKGKSTIFKVIKFALTGSDSIKKDIKPWIEEIILEFSIGKIDYTCAIDRTGRDRGYMYRMKMDEFLQLRADNKLDSRDNDREFEFKNRTQFEEKMQEFFFDHFSFYTLKYTAKNSAKDNFDLSTANLSWSTYFKSIYLESSNYEHLFFNTESYGAQGKKIFEMILGLPLTYPINMLNLQLEKTEETIGKIKLIDKSKTEQSKGSLEKLEKRYQIVIEELEKAKNAVKGTLSERAFVEEYNQIQERVNKIRILQRSAEENYQFEKVKQAPLDEELYNLRDDKKKISTEINRLSKQDLNVELYRQAESFFTNLEIKTCPHCETTVSETKKIQERQTHECSLCGETPTHQKIEEEELQLKATRIKEEILSHQKKLGEVSELILRKQTASSQLTELLTQKYEAMVKVPSLELDNAKLQELEKKIYAVIKERREQKGLFENRENYIKEEAVLKFQIDELKKQKTSTGGPELSEYYLNQQVLEYALSSLAKKRIQLNADILSKLQDLILKEVNSFGLISIEKVEIDDNLNLALTQNGVIVGFSELEPGEKLRVKLAFYLSLIQLDIEYSLGRHPRFLIFDSPGSEEMVPKHLNGLSDMFKSINERFKDHMQIFVGSALREFQHIAEPKKTFIRAEDEFVF